jgi:NAD(P)H-quinone oxidoreductase subunit 5
MDAPTTSPLAFLVLAAPLAFGAVALAAAARPGPRPRHLERAIVTAGWFGVVVAGAGAAAVALGGQLVSPTLGWGGLGASVRLDALSVTMLAMIALLALVISRFSATYLDGDERHGVFLGRLAATIAAVEVLVLAGNLALLVTAWIATSLALHQLLVFYRDRPAARNAARKKFIVARVGDAFLLAAVAVLVTRFGTGDLQEILEQAPAAVGSGWGLGAVEAAALLVAVAALLKSAQFPTHGWLVEVMETPTPVSALLHAGILNAGPFLAMRLAFLLDDAHLATAMLIAVGGGTALFASVVLLTQPAVKVALGYSSAAHMGFMLMVCGLGVFPAALLHLVAHSFYKAHAFLSSGSVIDEARAAKVALPRRLGHPGRVLASLGLALAIYLPLAALLGVEFRTEWPLLALGGILVMGTTQLLAPAVDSTGGTAGVVRAAGLAVGVTLAFFTLELGAHELLYGLIPEDLARTSVHALLTAGVLAAFATVVGFQILEPATGTSARRRRWAVHLRNGLYANALFDRAVGALRAGPAGTGPTR